MHFITFIRKITCIHVTWKASHGAYIICIVKAANDMVAIR